MHSLYLITKINKLYYVHAAKNIMENFPALRMKYLEYFASREITGNFRYVFILTL